MRKSRIMIGILISVVLIGIFAGGCSVTPENDKKQVVAEIDGTQVLKAEYNDYMAYYQMYFEASGMTFPTDDELKTLKKDVLNDLIRVKTLTAQAKKEGVTIDDKDIATNTNSMMTSLKETLGEEKYNNILSEYNTDDASLENFLRNFLTDYSYSNTLETTYNEKIKADTSNELNSIVGKVGGIEIKKDLYNYRLANEELLTYYQTQQALATDDETMKKTNKTIFDTIAEQNEMIKYAEDKKMTIKQEDIDTYIATQTAFAGYLLPGDDALQQFLDAKFLTVSQFRELQKQDAKAAVATQAIQDDIKSNIKLSDSEIQKYYDENKESYDTSTVSAKHILTEDQALADQIYAETKDMKNITDFDATMEKYKTDTNIREAADLGAFTKTAMIKEFSDAAFSTSVNTVSTPVKTEYGYHIIYVYDKTEKGITPLEDKKEEITKTLTADKIEKEYNTLKTKLLNKTKIEMNEDKLLTPIEAYLEQLKKDLKVKVYENRI